MSDPNIRDFSVAAKSTDVFGRVLLNCREQHYVIDGPVQNGCPGEAVTPVEAFLSGIAACGVELLQVIGKDKEIQPRAIRAGVRGIIDRSNPVRQDYAVFNTVKVDFEIEGVTSDDGHTLVEAFKKR